MEPVDAVVTSTALSLDGQKVHAPVPVLDLYLPLAHATQEEPDK